MRGDLQQMPLADIFQTIGFAKMEGILRVCNPVEQRLVHFHGGLIRIVVPPRAATRRLGHRLVQAGVLDPEQLRMALLEQRKAHKPLGELLVSSGYVSAEQIDDIIALQVTEELFGLFTWEHGEFEFFKGPPQDPALAERLLSCPEFEVNSLLLEVARRSDEWESILASLRSLDEIPVPIEESSKVNGLDETHRSVLVAIDGKHTYRELGDITVLSVFDCARAARDLMNQGLIAVASDDHLLSIAQSHHEQGNIKMALLLALVLRDRADVRPLAMVRQIAIILRKANESKLACELLLEAAQLQTDADLALELATEALAMNPRDLGAQSFLRTTMLAHLPPDAPEVESATLTLLDGLLLENDVERVFAIVDETRQMEACTPAVMVREARALAKKKDRDGAVAVLIQAANVHAEAGDVARQIEILELAYRFDRDRRDLHKQLRALRSTPQKRAAKYAAIAGAAVLLLAIGAVWLAGKVRTDRLLAAGTEVGALLAAGDLAGASTSLDHWQEKLGDCGEIDDLRSQVRFAQTNELQRQQKDAMKAAADQLQQAGELALAGRLTEAFKIYQEMRTQEALRRTVDESIAARVDALLRDLIEAQKHLPGILPERPNDLTEQQQIEETLTALRRQVSMRLRDAAHALLRQRDEGGLPMELDADKRQQLITAAEHAVEVLDRGVELTHAYEEASARNDQQRRLDPLFKSALEAERRLDFAGALVSYRQLAAADAGTAGLRTHFTNKVRQLEGIVGVCTAIAAATAAGDFATANREFQTLALAHPQIPFPQIVRLPVTITTSMPGAKVRWNGADCGNTPMLASYAPGTRNEIDLQLARFEPVHLTLPSNHNGHLDVLLTLQANRKLELPANIDQPMAIAGSGRVFAVDRSGNVLAFDAQAGKVVWNVSTHDTAGYLSPPLLYRDWLFVGSLDGTLRAMAQADGAIVWERGELPTEFQLVMLDGRLAIVDSARSVRLFDPKAGEPLGRIDLPSDLRADPVGVGSLLVATLGDGTTIAVDAKDQQMRWQSKAGDLGQMLTLTEAGVLALRDDGMLTLLDPARGEPRWHRQLAGTPTGRPSTRGNEVLLTFDDRAIVLAIDDGRELWRTARPEVGWLSAAYFVGDHIAAPLRNGSVLLFRNNATTPRCQLAGDRSLSLCGKDRDFVLMTAGRTLSLFRQLP